MARNITHIQTLDKAVGHLDSSINAIHTKLSNLYVLLNRPIENISQEQALTILHDAMGRLRNMQEDRNYIVNSAAGIDSDLGDIMARIDSLRIPRVTEMAFDTPMEGSDSILHQRSALRTAADELDDMIQRGQHGR